LLIALAIGALAGGALWILRRPRGGSLRDRMAAFVAAVEDGGEDGGAGRMLGNKLLRGAERSLEGRAWWTAFKERMDVARVEIPPARLIAWVSAGTLGMFVLAPLVTGSPAWCVLAVAVPIGTKVYVERLARKQRKAFADQLPDNLQVIASAMRAGHSFVAALSVVVDDAQEPTKRELDRVVADERLGVPLEAALAVVVRRMQSRDLEQVALVASLQRETGGNTAEVLDQVAETVRDRMALQRMVNTLTAQGRLSRWVLTALPCVLLVLITVINPAYVAPLYHTTAGHLLLGFAAAMVCAGSYAIKRIVDIKV
jgi:tight adherence protein B